MGVGEWGSGGGAGKFDFFGKVELLVCWTRTWREPRMGRKARILPMRCRSALIRGFLLIRGSPASVIPAEAGMTLQ